MFFLPSSRTIQSDKIKDLPGWGPLLLKRFLFFLVLGKWTKQSHLMRPVREKTRIRAHQFTHQQRRREKDFPGKAVKGENRAFQLTHVLSLPLPFPCCGLRSSSSFQLSPTCFVFRVCVCLICNKFITCFLFYSFSVTPLSITLCCWFSFLLGLFKYVQF